MNNQEKQSKYLAISEKFGSLQYDSILNDLPEAISYHNKNNDLCLKNLAIIIGSIKSLNLHGGVLLPKELANSYLPISNIQSFFSPENPDLDFALWTLGTMLDLGLFENLYSIFKTHGLFKNNEYTKNNTYLLIMSFCVLKYSETSSDEKQIAFGVLSERLKKEGISKNQYSYLLYSLLKYSLENSIKDFDYVCEDYPKYEKTIQDNYLSCFLLEVGKYFYLKKQTSECKKVLLRALQHAPEHFSQLNYEILRMLKLIDAQISIEQEVFHELFLTINEQSPDIIPGSDFPTTTYKYLAIKNNSIVKTNDIEKLDFHEGPFLDLASKRLKTSEGKVIHLTKKRLKALIGIMAYGHLGIRELTLAEFVFGEEKIQLKSYCSRIQDLITQLQKLDLPIVRSNNKIYFKFDKLNYPAILFSNWKNSCELNFFKHKHGSINRNLLMSEYGMARSTANKYLKHWISSGRIVPIAKDYGSYQIIKSSIL